MLYLLAVLLCAAIFFLLNFFLQLRVIRAFKSTLEDLEERRSLHSIRSFRSGQCNAQNVGSQNIASISSLLYPNRSYQQKLNQVSQQSPPGSNTVSVASPTPSNIADIPTTYIDEEEPIIVTITDHSDNSNGDVQKTTETRIWIEIDFVKWICFDRVWVFLLLNIFYFDCCYFN